MSPGLYVVPARNAFRFRSVSASDKEMILEWRNRENVRRYMYTDHVISEAEHDRWFSDVLDSGQANHYFIFSVKEIPYGFVSITKIDRKHGTCSWAFYIGPESPPLGTGVAMEYFALEYVFEEINIRKLNCEVISSNQSVIKLHKKFGFQEEGVLKDQVNKFGDYQDVIVLSMFSEQWQQNKERLKKICFRKEEK